MSSTTAFGATPGSPDAIMVLKTFAPTKRDPNEGAPQRAPGMHVSVDSVGTQHSRTPDETARRTRSTSPQRVAFLEQPVTPGGDCIGDIRPGDAMESTTSGFGASVTSISSTSATTSSRWAAVMKGDAYVVLDTHMALSKMTLSRHRLRCEMACHASAAVACDRIQTARACRTALGNSQLFASMVRVVFDEKSTLSQFMNALGLSIHDLSYTEGAAFVDFCVAGLSEAADWAEAIDDGVFFGQKMRHGGDPNSWPPLPSSPASVPLPLAALHQLFADGGKPFDRHGRPFRLKNSNDGESPRKEPKLPCAVDFGLRQY